MKNLLARILVALITLGCLCQCQSYQTSTLHSTNESFAFERCMVNDVKKSKPWEPKMPSHDDAGGGPIIIFEDEEFHKGVDDPRKLLVQAREGDYQAQRKLEDYLENEPNPDRAVRLESKRISAFARGIDGIARYYGENKRNWSVSKDRRLIEQALRHMESEALAGNWIYAVALYQFLGSLSETGEHLPWGENEELSAKWLELVYKSVDKRAFEAVVKDEAARMGQGGEWRLNKDFFPHTPEGWKPEK